jgi:NitT/TauT family transport system substrate-binding protein
MIRGALAAIIFVIGLVAPASAQERVTVGALRLASNGALFLAAARGYFKAEGLDVEMRAYPSAQSVLEGLADGTINFGITTFAATTFNLAGKGAIKAIAAQARERRGFEGNDVVASNAAYDHGLHKLSDLGNKVVAISRFGSVFHYQLGQIAHSKGFSLGGMILKPLYSLDAMARAVQNGDVDAAILPSRYAHDLLVANQAKFIGWCSDVDEQQLGALFTSAAMIATRRATVEKFVRAYRRGVADYAAALLRRDRYGKRVVDAKADAAAKVIAHYVSPDGSNGADAVEAGAYFIDPKARIDINDIARQIAWYQAHGLVDRTIDARQAVDLSFTAGP